MRFRITRIAGLFVFVAVLSADRGLLRGQPAPSGTEFFPGNVRQLSDLPAGSFRSRIEALDTPARDRAVAWLGNFHFTDFDLNSLRVDAEGGVFYVDPPPTNIEPLAYEPDPPTLESPVPVSPFPTNLVFHSRPGAPNVLYLNFAGEDVSGTAWNSTLERTVIPAVSFSTDADFSSFSADEQLAIRRIWQRVAEDFAPFDIDVTTERPEVFDRWTAHALITRNTDANGASNPASGAGGVAYVGVFGNNSYSTYRPAWVYANNLGGDESYIAEAASHEIGHNLGLSHDGTTSGQDYYGGHGSGPVSWGPIMGTGYNRNVSQWSRGDYYRANNSQDDLATMASRLSYRIDDHGDTDGTATGLLISGGTNVVSSTPESDPKNLSPMNKGIMDGAGDVDVFSFATGFGLVDLSVEPWISPSARTRGGNLDVLLELYDSGGNLVASDNPEQETKARVLADLDEGIYYLHIRNSGTGDPLSATPWGYTDYGSVGQYFISGTVVPSDLAIPPGASLSVADVTAGFEGSHQFEVEYVDNAAVSIASIDDSDLLVTGPGGYREVALLLETNPSIDARSVVATYAVPPPSGTTWTDLDNGLYVVSLQPQEVIDVEGEWAESGVLGVFNVAIPRRTYFVDMTVNPGWELEPLWEHGAPDYGSGGPAAGIDGPNILAYNLDGNYENRLDPVFATTPPIDVQGATSATLRFQRWLRIKNGDTAAIQVSADNENWFDVWNSPRTVSDNGWREVQYALPNSVLGSAAVRIRWSMASGPSRNEIGWNIDEVEVLTDGSVDTSPPTAVLTAANLVDGGSPVHELAVEYFDDTAVRVSELDREDLLITGPNGYSNTVDLVGVNLAGDGPQRVATYSVAAPSGTWSDADNGVYTVTLQAVQVADVGGNFADESVLGQFSVAIPASQQRLLVNPTLLFVNEGETAAVSLSLAEQPETDVWVEVARISGDSDLVIESGVSNRFDAGNWSSPVSVRFRAQTDMDQDDGSATFEVRSEGLPTVTVLVNEADNTPNSELRVTSNNPDWGSVEPSVASFPVGTSVEVTATAATYFEFAGWSGDVTSAANPLTVVMDGDIVLEAAFREILAATYGTPHWWLASAGQAGDFDAAELLTGANGIPLWQSYIAGLDPDDPSSQLELRVRAGNTSSDVVLEWSPVTNRVYSLLARTNTIGTFTPLPDASGLSSEVSSYTNMVFEPSTRLFYRLQVTLP